MSRKHKIAIGVGVVAVLVVVAGVIGGGDGEGVSVRVEDVGRQDLVARVTATGHVEPKTSIDISADVSGRIVQLTVEEGDDVEEGQLILVIDPARFEAAVDRAEAALSDAQAREAQARGNYQQAQRDWERIRQLKEAAEGMITETEYEQARTNAEVQQALSESARHGVNMARASVREARDNLAKTVIEAPMSGRVTRLNVERGETAVVGTMNNPGSLLLTIADLSVMEAVIEVDETDVPEIEIGDSTVVTIDAFRGQEFHGRVTKIGNSSIRPRSQLQSSSEQAIDFEVRITLENPGVDLRTDLSATADVITAVRPDVLAIPIIALTLMDPSEYERIPVEGEEVQQEEDDVSAEEVIETPAREAASEPIEGVYVLDGDRVRFKPVEIGIAGDNYFEVVAGLEEGETVVSGTYQAIRELEDGALVRVEGQGDQTGPSAEDSEG
ncbi:MAG: efflux RND transporter periplasmic adaptor subunit [marine benthic group bacterium]|nr:efflux RND transporter periplasmic adaptor subunit [Gemmatimonadota bacterium]